MRIAREIQALPGVAEAVVLMGTPMNRDLLASAGFAPASFAGATPMDLVVALRAESPDALEAALRELARLLEGGEGAAKAGGAERGYGDLSAAALAHPEARLVSVSVPGPYAAFVAHRALDAGRHVFLFSNNVSLEDEIALKRRGREHGLLVMGPDCGTAIIAGVGLGFANRVPRGRIGIVGASGTGIQEASCLVAREGEGISHAIGTGSQDLSAAVGGMMTEMGVRLLAADPGTQVLLIIAKHPDEEVAERIHRVLLEAGKPAAVRYLGKPPRPSQDGVLYAATIDDAALGAVALARGTKPLGLDHRAEVAAASKVRAAHGGRVEGRLVGLYGGGSLAKEAKLQLAYWELMTSEPDQPLPLSGPFEGQGHLLVDTGEDFYTVGKPHPMVDQTVRCGLIRKAVQDPTVGILLLDLVLGDGAHLDPAPEIVAALGDARGAPRGRPLEVVASVTGTDADPQQARRQAQGLEAAGVHVRSSAARAALFAGALLAERTSKKRSKP
jgi:FdrA protein